MVTHFVYMLFDNSKNIPLYVGATTDIKRRFSGHNSLLLKNYTGKADVVIEVLEETDIKKVADLEQYWYWQIRSWGFELLQKDCKKYRVSLNTGYSFYQIALLSIAFEKSPQTIIRWIKDGNDILTSDKAKLALKSKPSPSKP